MLDCYNRQIHYLRISVTDRCNLRCRYCMPEEGVKQLRHEDILSFEEIAEFTRTAVQSGVDKVRMTGGEPLVRKNIVTLVKMIAEIDGVTDYAMTTNGTLLNLFALELKQAGLHRLNISLDTMDPEIFSHLTRGGNLNQVLYGIKAAQQAGFSTIKLNCVIRKSSDEQDAREVAEFAAENGLAVRFIRKMRLETGEFWQVEGGQGGNCQLCNRLRLSSDGFLYPCLFQDERFSIRDLGSERALEMAIKYKPKSGYRSESNKFYQLGG